MSSSTTSSVSPATGARASLLAKTGLKLFAAGRLEDAARAIREAISLSPQNIDVLAAFQTIQKEQNVPSKLIPLCQKLSNDGDVTAGNEALKLLNTDVQISDDDARQILEILEDDSAKAEAHEVQDRLLSTLLINNAAAKKSLAGEIKNKDIEIIYKIYNNKGAESLDSLALVVLDTYSNHDASHIDAVADKVSKRLGQLLLDDLESSESRTKYLKPLSRMFATRSHVMRECMSDRSATHILDMLSLKNTPETRTPALLITAKYLEALEIGPAEELLRGYIVGKMSTQSDGDLECAFSVASAIFPIVTPVATPLFLTDGFVQSIIPILKSSKANLERSGLEMLSSACVDKACREVVSKYCLDYLQSVAKGNTQGKAIAALILAKTSGDTANSTGEGPEDKRQMSSAETEKLADEFKNMVIKGDETAKQSSIEGLAYTSLNPKVKEKIVKDKSFLKTLFKNLAPATNSNILYGSLSILNNLSKYTKPLSSEQQKLAQLRGYANAQPTRGSIEVDPLDKDTAVTSRCRILVDAGVVPALVTIGKKVSPTAIFLVCNVLYHLSKSQAHRGTIAQQGGVKQLIQFHISFTSTSATERTRQDKEILHVSAHALARILISVNPNLVFGASSLPLSSAISPLLSLMQSVHNSGEDERDLLPIFESLLALTNLASTTDSARDIIIRLGWPLIEELLLADNDMIQRADVELICNLMMTPQGVAKFADGSKQSQNRLNILIALADADDLATRRAAGGAIAMLTEWDSAVQAVLKRERGVEILLQMAAEENDEMTHRGAVTIRNIVYIGGEEAVKKVRDENGEEVFKDIIQRCQAEEILAPAVEVLKKLMD